MKIPNTQEIENALKFNLEKQEFILTKDLFLRVFGLDIILPKGLTTDGASFPFFINIFIKGTDNRVMLWAILHDYIYRTGFMPRLIADAMFREGLKISTNRFFAFISYSGLRLFGWYAWRKNKKQLLKFPEAKQRLKKYLCQK